MGKKIGRYELGPTIGEGQYAKVKKATNRDTGETVAIKIFDKTQLTKLHAADAIKKEIAIMKLVRHPNVVRMVEVLSSENKIFLVLEFVSGGDLIELIEKEGKLSEADAFVYFKQILDGVEFCHAQGVSHRDLKPENLLIDRTTHALKISDFGLSALRNSEIIEENLQLTACGTPNYVSPEMLAGKGYDGSKADIWAIGIILFVILAAELPFDEETVQKLYQKIKFVQYKFPSHFSSEVKDLIRNILVPDPDARFTISEIRQHPWFTKYESFVRPISIISKSPPSSFNEKFKEDDEDLKRYRRRQSNSDNPTPLSLNAFELIGLSCGLDSNLMFSNTEPPHLKRFSSTTSPSEIISRVSAIFENSSIQHKVFASSFTIKASITSPSRLGITVQVLSIVPGLYVVDCRREKGEVAHFLEIYGLLVRQLGSVVAGQIGGSNIQK